MPTNTRSYDVVEGWEQLPAGYVHRDVAGVAVDGEDRVFLICRGDHPLIVYDQKGHFLRSWGEGEFTYRTHGITVAPDGTVWCTDDGNHTVRQFTPNGKLLLTLGTLNTPSDTGYDGKDSINIPRAAGPFNRPTNLAIGPRGDLYVSDGYGNCRVHQFSPTGTLKRSWGVSGTGPGQFHLPHGIAGAPRARRRLARRRVRERGDVDVRGQSRARARGHAHVPEVRAVTIRATTMPTLEAFAAACHRILTEQPGRKGREQVCALLQEVLKDDAFVSAHLTDDTPERKILYQDPQLGFCILAHVYRGARESAPHDHGHSWAIYGQ